MKPWTITFIFIAVLSSMPCLAAQDDLPSVDIRLASTMPGKPPLTRLFLDVTLRNPERGPRWFLLQDDLGQQGSPAKKRTAHGVEVFMPEGQGRVIVGRFSGVSGFQALLLPAGAEIKLHSLPIRDWSDPSGPISMEVVIAKGVTVGGRPVRTWFDADPLCDAKAEVREVPGARTRAVSFRSTPGNRELSVVLEGATSFEITVARP